MNYYCFELTMYPEQRRFKIYDIFDNYLNSDRK